MMQFAMSCQPARPMPERISPWGIYDVFTVREGEQIFLAVVTETQWRAFCEAFGFADLLADERLASNNLRVQARDWLIPALRQRLADRPARELAAITLPDGARAGQQADTVLLPIAIDGQRAGVRLSPPRLGEHSAEVLGALGYSAAEIAQLSATATRG